MIVGVFLGFGVVTKEATLPAQDLADRLRGRVQFIGLSLDAVNGIEPGESFGPEITLNDAHPDVLVVPGGFGCRPMSQDQAIVDLIREIATNSRGVLTISTGTLLLAATGLLNGQRCAGHWLTAAELEPFGVELSDRQIERSDTVFTASGVLAAREAVPLLVDVIHYGPQSPTTY